MSGIDEGILKNYIENSGHPVCIKASNILAKNGWYVKNAPRYTNDKAKPLSEVDIYAWRKSNFIKDVDDALVIECKKSKSHPWIFFKQGVLNTNVYSLNIVENNDGYIYDYINKNSLFQKHYYYNKNLSTYNLVGLSNPDNKEGKAIYDAVGQVLNATFFYINQLTKFYNSRKLNINFSNLYYPIIVVDGALYEAEISGSTKIKETNHISLFTEYELDEPAFLKLIDPNLRQPLFSKPFIVDIVKLDYLDEFLKSSFNLQINPPL